MNKQDIFVKIKNDGLIDVNGLHLMGVSSKRNEEKIGFFGSGNKYAIALLLREEIPFKIFSGEKEIKITTEPVMFRSQLFEQILVNGEKTSLTTAMGVDWETWFAVREIYCNALDEGGASINLADEIKPIKNKTTVFIKLTPKLKKFFSNINNYILVNKQPTETVKTYYGEVDFLHRNSKDFICFRKGIRIFPKNEIKSLYNYNFGKIEINESRTYKYEHQIKEQIASALAVTTNKEIILNFLRNAQNNYEDNLYWEDSYVHDSLSQAWHDILKGKRIYPESVAKLSGDFEGKVNSFIVQNELADKIAQEIKECEVVGKSGKKEYMPVEVSQEKQQIVNDALNSLRNIGYGVIQEIKIVKPFMDDVIGWYDRDKDIIFLAEKHITMVGEVRNTILEEYFHAKGLVDGQRSFVTFLIDELIRAKIK